VSQKNRIGIYVGFEGLLFQPCTQEIGQEFIIIFLKQWNGNFGSNREDVTVLINLYARRRSEHENLEVT